MLISRILIVGLGSIGSRHLKIARQLMPNADIRVLRHNIGSETPENANSCFFDVTEAISFKPEIAVIAGPASFHINVAQILAESGAHLLIEKPLSSSIQGVTKLINTCHNLKRVILVGYNLRFLPSLKYFRNLLINNIAGKILSVRSEAGQYLPSWRPGKNYEDSVSANQLLGGGVLLELSHEIDYLRWIFGEVDWIQASVSTQSNLKIDVEDTAHLLIGFASKDKAYQLIASLNLDFIRHDASRVCIAIGEKGTLRWDGLKGEVSFYGSDKKDWQVKFNTEFSESESYLDEWKNFIASINNASSPVISGDDGLKVIEIIEATKAASITNSKVFL